jgi:hypothetical protein
MAALSLFAFPLGNLTDARYFSAQGVAWVGFSFDPLDADYCAPEQAAAIKGWLHGPRCAGYFRHQDADNIAGIAGFASLDALVLDIDDAGLAAAAPVLPVFFRVKGEESDAQLSGLPSGTLGLLCPAGLSPAQLQRLEGYAPLWIEGLRDAEAAQAQLEHYRPQGLVLSGGKEWQTGVKPFEDLDALFEELERLDERPG